MVHQTKIVHQTGSPKWFTKLVHQTGSLKWFTTKPNWFTKVFTKMVHQKVFLEEPEKKESYFFFKLLNEKKITDPLALQLREREYFQSGRLTAYHLVGGAALRSIGA